MFGPPIGTYMYIKNANKLISSASNLISKAGSKLGNFIGSGAQKMFKRSAAGVAWQDKERMLDNQGLTEGRTKLRELFKEPKPGDPKRSWLERRARGAATGLMTRGMTERSKRNFAAQLAGQDNEIYRGEVEAYKTDLGREYSDKASAQKHFWDRMGDPNLTAPEAHALHDHIAALDGGASWLDDVWTGQMKDPTPGRTPRNIGSLVKENHLANGDALTGIQRAIDNNPKLRGGMADVSYAVRNRPLDYISALANGEQAGFLDLNWDEGNTVTYHDIEDNLVEDAPVILDTDHNGGLTYTGERPKNMSGFGKRLAYAQETSGKMTDEAAGLIFDDKQRSGEIEHVVFEAAKRRVEDLAANGGAPINPAKDRNPFKATTPPTPPTPPPATPTPPAAP